jgi:hypothetical protein
LRINASTIPSYRLDAKGDANTMFLDVMDMILPVYCSAASDAARCCSTFSVGMNYEIVALF